MPFQKGHKLGGRTVDDEWIKRIARKYCPDAFNKLVDGLNDDDPAIRVKCAEKILERGYGKAREYVQAEVSGGLTIKVSIA